MMDIEEELGDDSKPEFVFLRGNGTVDELQWIIDHYKKLGFNRVWHGHENSTLCIQKIKDM